VSSQELRKRAASSVALKETVVLALDTLRAHKLRSFLTLLGVILAVFTLVGVMSIVEGLNRYVANNLASMGANAFVVNQFGIITSHQQWLRAQRRPPIRVEDYEAVRDQAKLLKQVAGADDRITSVRYGNELLEDVTLIGTTPNFLEVRGMEVGRGRFFTPSDEDRRAPLCFIGTDIVKRLFPNTDPLNKPLRVGSQVYTIVGVAKEMGTVLGQSRDNFVFIPFSSYLKVWSRGNDSIFMLAQAEHPELMEAAADEIRAILRARRHVPYKDEDNFGIIMPSSITGLWQDLSGNLFAVAVGLTSVFLVVGGIVIMNIMLASVTERTREIGIRKSLGAKRRHIVMQFLVEAATLAAVGGLLGILAALGLSALVSATTPVPIFTPLRAIVLALLLATSVGLFFGIYPAQRAAKLDPIEALRQEA
jgi:putative ABC transport system permease protein